MPALTLLILAIGLGIAVRISPVLSVDFPLMDGGMFYAMVRDLQASRFVLPFFTSYNAAHIPFAYPPLALYLAAAIQSLTGWRLEEIFRWLPFSLSLATIPAFYALSRTMLRSERASAAAVIAFALLPETGHWNLMGGGLTRALGSLFAILALRSVYLMYTRGRRRDVVLSIAFAAAAVVSHLQWGWFVAYSAGLMFLAFGRNRRGLLNSLYVGLGTLALTSPWWAAVIARHGPSPLLAASQHGWPILSGLSSLILTGGTEEYFVPVLAFAAILGALVSLRDRRYWLPAWTLMTFALDGWVASTAAVVPLALLVGIGIADVLWPLLAGTLGGDAQLGRTPNAAPRRSFAARWVMVLLAAYAVFAVVGAQAVSLSALSASERDAMRWISRETPPSSRFLVVTSERWPVDRSSEWFPVLAQRVSVGTVQGSEWLPSGEFARRVEANDDLRTCRGRRSRLPGTLDSRPRSRSHTRLRPETAGHAALGRAVLGDGTAGGLLSHPARRAYGRSTLSYRLRQSGRDCLLAE